MRSESDYPTWSDDDMATQRPFGVVKGVDIDMASQAKIIMANWVYNEGRKIQITHVVLISLCLVSF